MNTQQGGSSEKWRHHHSGWNNQPVSTPQAPRTFSTHPYKHAPFWGYYP